MNAPIAKKSAVVSVRQNIAIRLTLPRLLLTVLALGLATAPLRADPPLGKAADNAIFAQTLVNQVMASHPELLVVGFHAVAPGATGETMIASNLDRIGKKDDDDDMAVAKEGKTILAPNMTETNKFEVQVPMKDSAGNIIGAIGLVFNYHAGDDEVQLHVKALQIRDGLARQIPALADLFKPAR